MRVGVCVPCSVRAGFLCFTKMSIMHGRGLTTSLRVTHRPSRTTPCELIRAKAGNVRGEEYMKTQCGDSNVSLTRVHNCGTKHPTRVRAMALCAVMSTRIVDGNHAFDGVLPSVSANDWVADVPS